MGFVCVCGPGAAERSLAGDAPKDAGVSASETTVSLSPSGFSQGLPRNRRIRSPGDFRRVMRGGEAFKSGDLLILAKSNSCGWARLGISIRRTVCGSVYRNRLKRWIREAFRTDTRIRGLPLDMVIVVRRAGPELGFAEIAKALKRFVDQQGTKRCGG